MSSISYIYKQTLTTNDFKLIFFTLILAASHKFGNPTFSNCLTVNVLESEFDYKNHEHTNVEAENVLLLALKLH